MYLIIGILLVFGLIPLSVDTANAVDYKKHITAEDLGILQLAAHDLFNVNRCIGQPPTCEVKEHEDGKLNLSTLFEDTTTEPDTPFTDLVVAMGGEHRNRENIMVFTVASELGEKYKDYVNYGMNSETAKNMVIKEYHNKLADSYERTFGEGFPTRDNSFNSLKDRFQQNLALRTIHDFLPGKIKFEDKFVSTLDPDLRFQKLNDKEIQQKSSKLDGKFDAEFLDINICLDPPECDFTIIVNLLEADKSFGEQLKTNESFEAMLEELTDGLYNEDDRALYHIRNIMAMGQNF